MKPKILYILLLTSALTSQAAIHYKGDVNKDGMVDLADMATLASAIKAGNSDKAFDLNVSGKVDESDLHFLADIIISGKLIEDTGFDVGIGGWDDDGEDYGGTLGAPARKASDAVQTRLYIRNPKRMDTGNCYSIEFGVSEGTELPVGFLINLSLPGKLSMDAGSYVQLSSQLRDNYKIYGTPILKQDWEGNHVARFIIFSQDATPSQMATGVLGQISYAVDKCYGRYQFKQTQMYFSDGLTTLPEHEQYIQWGATDDSGINSVNMDTKSNIYSIRGEKLLEDASATDIDNLDAGVYIVIQDGRSTKIIK